MAASILVLYAIPYMHHYDIDSSQLQLVLPVTRAGIPTFENRNREVLQAVVIWVSKWNLKLFVSKLVMF